MNKLDEINHQANKFGVGIDVKNRIYPQSSSDFADFIKNDGILKILKNFVDSKGTSTQDKLQLCNRFVKLREPSFIQTVTKIFRRKPLKWVIRLDRSMHDIIQRFISNINEKIISFDKTFLKHLKVDSDRSIKEDELEIFGHKVKVRNSVKEAAEDPEEETEEKKQRNREIEIQV